MVKFGLTFTGLIVSAMLSNMPIPTSAQAGLRRNLFEVDFTSYSGPVKDTSCDGPILRPPEEILEEYCRKQRTILDLFEANTLHVEEEYRKKKSAKKDNGEGKEDGKGKKKGKKNGEGKKEDESDECECQAHVLGFNETALFEDAVIAETSGFGFQFSSSSKVFDLCSDTPKPVGVININDYIIFSDGPIKETVYQDGAITLFGKEPVTFSFIEHLAFFDFQEGDVVSMGRADIIGGTRNYDSGFIQPLNPQLGDFEIFLIYACENGYDNCALPDGADAFFESPKFGDSFCLAPTPEPTLTPSLSAEPSSVPTVSAAPTTESQPPSVSSVPSSMPSEDPIPGPRTCSLDTDCLTDVNGRCRKCENGQCRDITESCGCCFTGLSTVSFHLWSVDTCLELVYSAHSSFSLSFQFNVS